MICITRSFHIYQAAIALLSLMQFQGIEGYNNLHCPDLTIERIAG